MPDAAAQRQAALDLSFDTPSDSVGEASPHPAAKAEAPAAKSEAPALQNVGLDQPVEIMNAACSLVR